MGGALNLSIGPYMSKYFFNNSLPNFVVKSHLIYPQKQNMPCKSVPHPLNKKINTEFYQSVNGSVNCNPSKWLWPAIELILPVFNSNCLFQFHSCWREIDTSTDIAEVLSLRAVFTLLFAKELRSSAEVKCLTLSSSLVRWSPAVQSYSSLWSHSNTDLPCLPHLQILYLFIYLFVFKVEITSLFTKSS